MRFLLNLLRLSVKELSSLWRDPIMLFLIVFAGILYMVKRSVWSTTPH